MCVGKTGSGPRKGEGIGETATAGSSRNTDAPTVTCQATGAFEAATTEAGIGACRGKITS